MAKQYVSAAKAHFDLLHSRKDPFHYKAGTLGLEAISKRGGGGEGHSKVIHQLWLTVCGGGGESQVPLSWEWLQIPQGSIFPTADTGESEKR